MTRKGEPTNASAQAEGVRVRAATDYAAIDWRQVDRTVRRLQARIVKAQREGRRGKVASLSRVLTRSFAGRATAVKRVTSNRGKRTPGVDGKRWTTHRQKAQAIDSLRVERYRASREHGDQSSCGLCLKSEALRPSSRSFCWRFWRWSPRERAACEMLPL